MTTIRQKTRKSGWLRLMMVAVPLVGLGLLTAGPGGVAQAARFSGDRDGGHMAFRGGSFGHQGRPAVRSMGGRRGGFRVGTPGLRSDFGAFRGNRGGSGIMFGNSLAMRGLMGMGHMQYRPLPSGPSFGAFSGRRPDDRSRAVGPPINGRSGYRLLRGGEGRYAFGRDHDFGQFRSRRRFDHDRFFDFGRYDHFRDHNRFDHDGFARYHRYGYYRFRFPTIVPYYGYVYPNQFLFGNWFGANTYWWWGHVLPRPGVTVILQF